MKIKLRVMISLWIGVIIFGSCEERADYLNWSRKVAKYCRYVKYSEESKRYECGPKLGEFYTYIIIHPDYDLPKNPIYPLVAYDGNDNVVMVGGSGKGQIWRMIKFEKWEFVRETEKGMKEVYYDEKEEAFIGLQMGDNKENVQSMAWWSRDGGKSWYRAKVPVFKKKANPETVMLVPKLPVGATAEAVGGGYAVAIGKLGGKPTVWRSQNTLPRKWQETNRFNGGGILPGSLGQPSDLTGVTFQGGKFQITDTERKEWTYEDARNEWDLTEAGGFAGGSGTVGDPYEITSASHLWLVRNHLRSHFELVQDLDLSVVTESVGFGPIGVGANPFTGTFDGKGKVIRNLMINRPRQGQVGLFGRLDSGGIVKNIGLENVNLIGRNNVGGLVGYNYGTIEKSYVTGDVLGQENVGGLVGRNMRNGTTENSYATVNVTGTDKVGGLVGYNEGEIQNSYATGQVRGTSNVGGFVGDINPVRPRIIGKNYWRSGSAAQGVGRGNGANVIERTEADLKALDAVATGWDATIWNFQAGQYPKLR